MLTQNSTSDIQRILKQFKKSLIYIAVFSAFINLLGLTQIFYMLQIFDRVMSSRSVETLILLTLIVTVLVITLGLLQFARTRLLNRLANRFDVALNERLFYAMFENSLKNPSEGNGLPFNDLNQLRSFINSSNLTVFFDAPWIPLYIIIIYIFHPWLAYFVIVVSIISIFLAIIQHINSKDVSIEAAQRKVISNNYINASMKDAEIISALGMRQQINKIWKDKYYAFLTSNTKASDINSYLSNLSSTIKTYAGMLVFGLAGYLAISGEITMGMVIGARILVGKTLAPVNQLIGSWLQIEVARMAYQRLNYLLDAYPLKQKPMPLLPPKGNIIVDKIFYLPAKSSKAIISDLSFILLKGEILAIIGQSAAGKSTLSKVLMGIWPATHGSVRLDGADIALWDRDNLGQYIGYLPQDVSLFTGTVAENICRFGQIDSDKIVAAATLAGIHHMILKLPNGYDTLIGANTKAHPLSGGEKQRIGLARAFYNKPIFIVLDEPNANLDEHGEADLLESLLQLKSQGTTVIIITHRPNILEAADKVLLLNKGMLQLFGPRDKVMDLINNKDASTFDGSQNQPTPNNIPIEDKSKHVTNKDKPADKKKAKDS